jgi:hypothetical protein
MRDSEACHKCNLRGEVSGHLRVSSKAPHLLHASISHCYLPINIDLQFFVDEDDEQSLY